MAFVPAIAVALGASASTAATIGTVASVAGAVGTVASAIGAMQAGKAEAGAANYNAEMARRDASSKEAAQRMGAQRQLSNIRASVGKSGATMAGTPLMVLAESAANAEIDALNTRYSGAAESNLQMSRAKNARTAGNLRAGTSLLSGMSRIL